MDCRLGFQLKGRGLRFLQAHPPPFAERLIGVSLRGEEPRITFWVAKNRKKDFDGVRWLTPKGCLLKNVRSGSPYYGYDYLLYKLYPGEREVTE